jgi:hypothetical protein
VEDDPQGGAQAQAAELNPSPARQAATTRLFLRLLGLVYITAFASLALQVEGLVGSHGIVPASEFLSWARSQTGAERYWLVPTLFWLDASDPALLLVSWGGVALAALLACGIAPAAVLALLWACYLSLVSVGNVFLGYQWDALLLETGFLAIFVAPLGSRLRAGQEPPWVSLWLLRWLLFRLTFASGVVKLASGDPTWRSLSALLVHYETQPLPSWVGWYAHQLPAWFQRLSCGVMFAIELLVPWLVFGPRRARLAAFFPLVALQVLIALTGNYAFFNLLTLTLCVLLLDDAALPWRRAPETASARPWSRFLLVPMAVVVGLLSLAIFTSSCGLELPWPRVVALLYRAVAPFRSINGYGLFAVMTTSRPEIVVEGSDDGASWKAYGFREKPGDLARAPAFVAPHQPRLDWQMWFAALGRCEQTPWFERFLERLREGSPPVLGLLATNPFPDHPPRYTRALVFDYRFTDSNARRDTGAWWRREPKGPYCKESPEVQ